MFLKVTAYILPHLSFDKAGWSIGLVDKVSLIGGNVFNGHTF